MINVVHAVLEHGLEIIRLFNLHLHLFTYLLYICM